MVVLVMAVAFSGLPAATIGGEPVSASSTTSTAEAPGVSGAGAADVSTDLQSPANITQLDLVGIDTQAQAELEAVEQQSPAPPIGLEPDTSPALEVTDPLGVLPGANELGVVTEKLSAAPFSVMGVTWDRAPGVDDVIVQYRTFRDGSWSDWGWVGASEEYLETSAGGPATRGATDPVFVPDATGVQVIVSSTGREVAGVKIVLIDPGAGPDGTGASVSSGAPSDAGDPGSILDSVPGDAPTDDATDLSTDAPSDVQDSTPSIAPDSDLGPSSGSSDAPESPSQGPGPTSPADPADPVAPPAPLPTATLGTASGDGAKDVALTFSSSVLAGGEMRTDVTAATSSIMPAAVMPMPRIVSRAAWGAAPPTCAIDYSSSTVAAAIHHTASTNNYTADQVPGLLRGFAAYHMLPEAQGGRGWCDIGYNFLVDKFGTIYEGRAGGVDLPAIGVHTGGFNSRVVGVSAIGNYQDVPPSAALAESLSQIIAWKFAQHRILANTQVTLVSGGGASKYPIGTAVTFNTIFGHRDAQLTTCPGQYLVNLFPDIRARVAQLSNPVVAESPEGSWDVASSGYAGFRIAGWARDPSDTGRTVTVQVLVNGVASASIAANQVRSDVGAHSFDVKVPAAVGTHTVCLRLVNLGGGSDVLLGCRKVTSRAANPVGAIDAVTASATGIYVAGWARDPETRDPIDVHVYANAIGTAWTANQARPDVQLSAPGEAGPNHGFSGTIPLAAGTYSVCAYGINVGTGTNALVGCRTVTVGSVVPPPAPRQDTRGALDVVRVLDQGRIQVAGWALDPDTVSPVQVHVYVDGLAVSAATAAGHRPDVAALFGKGAAHGFDRTISVTPGRHSVCVYALDTNGGRNALLGCRDVGIENKAPVGALDLVRAAGPGAVQVAGWALDPDTSASIQVHVYVDGLAVKAVTASGSRPDVAALYANGPAHGFDTVVPVGEGDHSVCVYALDSAGGRVPQVGCRQVTVVNKAPVGSLDVVRATGGGTVQVAGWALDPDTSASVQVHVYVDGRAVQAAAATGSRPDVAKVYGRGEAHGFDLRTPVAPGSRTVCAYALDTSGGRNTLLGCQGLAVS